MHKLFTGFVAVAALTAFASAGHACGFKAQKTVGTEKEEVVAMSTLDEGAVPAIVEETVEPAATECPDGATDCAPAEGE